MNDNRYALAGWLVFVKMAVQFVMFMFIIFVLATGSRTTGFLILRAMILVVLSLAVVYILYTLRRLLHERYDFHKADIVIPILAWFSVLSTAVAQIIEIMVFMNQDLKLLILVEVLFSVIPMGILLLIFGSILLKITDAQNTLLRPFTYTTLVSGVVLLSLLLAPFVIIVTAISDILLGLLFLSPEPEVEFV